MKMVMARSLFGQFSIPSYQQSLQVPLHVDVLLFYVEIYITNFLLCRWVSMYYCIQNVVVVASCYASITFQPLKIR
jgi:hypothetical protein